MILFYPLVKDGKELLNDKKGFVLIEALVTITIILTTVSIIIPSSIIVKKERQVLIDQQRIVTKLHDLIQPYIWDSKLLDKDSFSIKVKDRLVTIDISSEQKLIKGCAQWENVKQKTETFCLYGFKK